MQGRQRTYRINNTATHEAKQSEHDKTKASLSVKAYRHSVVDIGERYQRDSDPHPRRPVQERVILALCEVKGKYEI